MTAQEMRQAMLEHCANLTPLEVTLGPEKRSFIVPVPTFRQMSEYDSAVSGLDGTAYYAVLALRVDVLLQTAPGWRECVPEPDNVHDYLSVQDYPECERIIRHFIWQIPDDEGGDDEPFRPD